MSAYIVDPRTIDYLVAWARRHRRDHGLLRARWPEHLVDVPQELAPAWDGQWLALRAVAPDDLGQILLAENVRSVRHRYEDTAPDDLPGPCDQSRVWRYHFCPIDASLLRADWVIGACRCLGYQSCETPDWERTLAHAIIEAIREDAVYALTDDAPWGVTDADLTRLRHSLESRLRVV